MENNIYRITENVEYDIIDTKRHKRHGSYRAMDLAERFLATESIYRSPDIKIIPTLTYRDINSLDYLMTCMSTIYDINKQNWSDNEIIDNIIREFVEKIDDIRSAKTVQGYI